MLIVTVIMIMVILDIHNKALRKNYRKNLKNYKVTQKKEFRNHSIYHEVFLFKQENFEILKFIFKKF